MRASLLAILLFASSLTAMAPTPDWGDCQDELDGARSAASDASDAAEKVKSAFEELEKCRREPEIYDVLQNNCQRRRSDYASALSSLQDEMDTLDGRLHSVQSSCGYEFTINRMSSIQAAEMRLCSSYKKFVNMGINAAQ